MTDQPFPLCPFHTYAFDDADPPNRVADFFALSTLEGRYTSPSGSVNEEAVLGLYFSTASGFAPFTLSAYSIDGSRLLWGGRRDDEFPSMEYALFRAEAEDGIPIEAWRLYPLGEIDDSEWPDTDTRGKYEAARDRLSLFLWRRRAWLIALSGGKPIRLFHPSARALAPEWNDFSEIELRGAAELERLEIDGSSGER